jgi:hypothetical protein
VYPSRVPLPFAEHRTSAFYRALARDPADYGVIDLPLARTTFELGHYLLDQTVHRKRIPYDLDMDEDGEPDAISLCVTFYSVKAKIVGLLSGQSSQNPAQ